MREMIDSRLTSPEHHDDLFSNLLKAREEEKDGGSTFSDADLTGTLPPMRYGTFLPMRPCREHIRDTLCRP